MPREYPPTITFSSTLSAGKSARFWNVRAMPMRAIREAGIDSRFLPSNTIAPLVGRYRRLTQLNSVVLPAPLGPISAQIWPASIVNDRSASATMPPNSTRTSSTDNNAMPYPPGSRRART